MKHRFVAETAIAECALRNGTHQLNSWAIFFVTEWADHSHIYICNIEQFGHIDSSQCIYRWIYVHLTWTVKIWLLNSVTRYTFHSKFDYWTPWLSIHISLSDSQKFFVENENTEVEQVTAMTIQVGSTASVSPSPASSLDSTSWCVHRTTRFLPGSGSQHLSGGIHPTTHGLTRRCTPSVEERIWIARHTCQAHSKHQWWSESLQLQFHQNEKT